MKRLSIFKRFSIAVVAAVAIAALTAAPVRADNPPYVFIQPNTSGSAVYANPQPYAYGYFGACQEPMWTWHWSYYGERWIWR